MKIFLSRKYPSNASVRRLLAITFLCPLFISCTGNARKDKAPSPDTALHLDGPDMWSIQFRSGRPKENDSLLSATHDKKLTIKYLNENLVVIQRVKKNKFRATGWTDDEECKGVECEALSMRRAKLVTDWLVKNGASLDSFAPPQGRGSYFGPSYSPTENERPGGRRVDIELAEP